MSVLLFFSLLSFIICSVMYRKYSVGNNRKARKYGKGVLFSIIIFVFAIINISHTNNTSSINVKNSSNVNNALTSKSAEASTDANNKTAPKPDNTSISNGDVQQSSTNSSNSISSVHNQISQEPSVNTQNNSQVSTSTTDTTNTSNKSTTTYSKPSTTPSITSSGSGTLYVDANGNGLIKGHIDEHGVKIYHLPGDPYYNRTIHVSQWFKTEAEAQAAGYRHIK